MKARISAIVDIDPFGPTPAPIPPSPSPSPEPPPSPSPSPPPAGPHWRSDAPIPNVAFQPGATTPYDLLQHTEGVDPTLQHIAVRTGTYSPGITLAGPALAQITPDGTTPDGAVAEGMSYRIEDNSAPAPGPSPIPPSTDAAADFVRRCAGAFRTHTWKTAADLAATPSAATLTQGENPAPVIDLDVQPSGNGAMRYDVLPIMGGSMWWTNMARDLSLQFGSAQGGETCYAQFRYRVSQEVAAAYMMKLFLFGTGDTPALWQTSCTDLEIELNAQIFGHKYLMAYNACPGSCGASTVFIFDQGMPAGHVYLRPDEWMTCQLGVTLGPRETHNGHDWFARSNVKIWWQFEGEPELLVFDWTGGETPGSTPDSQPPCFGLCAGHDTGTEQRYGKLWLLPYNQELSAGAQPGSIWYADLILSTQKIPEVMA
jgi:hypothetical protein